jgi:hypothetical protein
MQLQYLDHGTLLKVKWSRNTPWRRMGWEEV